MKLRPLITLCLYTLVIGAAVTTGSTAVRDTMERTRGVTFGVPSRARVGVNASLQQYQSDDLVRALDLTRRHQFQLVRQRFAWNDLEPRPGEFQWDRSDPIVQLASERSIDLVAVLDTSPAWARAPGEQDLLTAPPLKVDDYAHFVRAFVERYGDRVHSIQVWDNPNVHPFWGRRVANPFEYTELLKAGASAARAVRPDVTILSAGLAPSRELIRGHPDLSDVLFLRGMYEAGAREYFDVLGAKAYGMWTGPEDRRVSVDIFNFSRVILLRDEMLTHGDAAKAVWAVEFGWNALPKGWEGTPSPWGSDDEQVQNDRMTRALRRARAEWPWMTALMVQTLQPDVPSTDPLWGFALVDRDWRPRSALAALEAAASAPVEPASMDWTRYYAGLIALALVALVAGWRAVVTAARLGWIDYWRALAARFAALPGYGQFSLIALAVIAFYYSPSVVLNFALLAVIGLLFALRLDLGLAIAVFTIPFYLFPKNLIGSLQFSLVELLMLALAGAWVLKQITGEHRVRPPAATAPAARHHPLSFGLERNGLESRLRMRVGSLDYSFLTIDLAVLFFVVVGLISVRVAANFGVANREFRVIVLEPAVLYGLLRASRMTRQTCWRLVDAFILSALAISLIGLYQYLFTDYVIVGEGVRRIVGVYGSPNNLALYLDRVLPLLAALVLYVENKPRRIFYGLAAVLVALCWYLTWSRGAWIGLLPGLLLIGFLSGRRARLAVAGLFVLGAIVLVPLLGTERGQSFLQTGTGTGFFRLSVWESGAEMIRDHPVWGVGLDNFLYEYPKYIKPEAWREPNLSHPHNILLDFWVRMGILGAVTLLWMLAEFYVRGARKLRDARRDDYALVLGLLAGMTAALAHGMIDAAYFYVDLAYVWMFMLGILVQVRPAVEPPRPPEPAARI